MVGGVRLKMSKFTQWWDKNCVHHPIPEPVYHPSHAKVEEPGADFWLFLCVVGLVATILMWYIHG
jgi:hypothetical protein